MHVDSTAGLEESASFMQLMKPDESLGQMSMGQSKSGAVGAVNSMLDNKRKSEASTNAWDKNRNLVNKIIEESDSDDESIMRMSSSNTVGNLNSGAAAQPYQYSESGSSASGMIR